MQATDFIDTVFTVDVMLVGVIVGGGQETLKRVVCTAVPKVKDTVAWKTAMALFAPVAGAVCGVLMIDPNGVAPPVALGLVGGLCASQVYDAIMPSVKSVLSRLAKSDD